jgi:hypothetical protein
MRSELIDSSSHTFVALISEISIFQPLPSTLVSSVSSRLKHRQSRASSVRAFLFSTIFETIDLESSRITLIWSRLLWMVEVYFVYSYCLSRSLALLVHHTLSRIGGVTPRDIQTTALRKSSICRFSTDARIHYNMHAFPSLCTVQIASPNDFAILTYLDMGSLRPPDHLALCSRPRPSLYPQISPPLAFCRKKGPQDELVR